MRTSLIANSTKQRSTTPPPPHLGRSNPRGCKRLSPQRTLPFYLLIPILSLCSFFFFSCEEPTPSSIQFTVTFNLNEGSPAITPQKVDVGEKASKPDDPTRIDYFFEGWFSDQSLTTSFDFNTPISADINLYAKWGIIKTTITHMGVHEAFVEISVAKKMELGKMVSKSNTPPIYTDIEHLPTFYKRQFALGTPRSIYLSVTDQTPLFQGSTPPEFSKESDNLLNDDTQYLASGTSYHLYIFQIDTKAVIEHKSFTTMAFPTEAEINAVDNTDPQAVNALMKIDPSKVVEVKKTEIFFEPMRRGTGAGNAEYYFESSAGRTKLATVVTSSKQLVPEEVGISGGTFISNKGETLDCIMLVAPSLSTIFDVATEQSNFIAALGIVRTKAYPLRIITE